jgi:hypothetical protein
MRLLMMVLVLGTMIAFGSQAATSNELRGSSAMRQNTKRLELSIVTDRQKYKRHGKMKISVMLTNADDIKDIFVYRTLGWGYLSSLTYTIRDSSGKRIQPTIIPDDLTPPIPRNDTTFFVKLPPQQFLGIHYLEGLDRLNLRRPGKYSIFVEYHCPISSTDVDLRDFWSKEDGTIRSNVVWIEVVP